MRQLVRCGGEPAGFVTGPLIAVASGIVRFCDGQMMSSRRRALPGLVCGAHSADVRCLTAPRGRRYRPLEDESRAGLLGIEPAAQRRVASADGRFVRLAANSRRGGTRPPRGPIRPRATGRAASSRCRRSGGRRPSSCGSVALIRGTRGIFGCREQRIGVILQAGQRRIGHLSVCEDGRKPRALRTSLAQARLGPEEVAA